MLVSDEISLHTADTLKQNARDDSGNSSALPIQEPIVLTVISHSVVSSEQDALIEIEEAILRIKDGSYGVCEITNKAIPAERLSAVPLLVIRLKAKPSMSAAASQGNRIAAGGIFGDVSDAPKLVSNDEEDDE